MRVGVQGHVVTTAVEILERIAPPHLERTRHDIDNAPRYDWKDLQQLRREREWSGEVQRQVGFQPLRGLLPLRECRSSDVVHKYVQVTDATHHFFRHKQVLSNRECLSENQVYAVVTSLLPQLCHSLSSSRCIPA